MKKERVELSVHTKMSRMDAVASAGDYVRAAAEQGQPAIAVTDHGCAQAFPEAKREDCSKKSTVLKAHKYSTFGKILSIRKTQDVGISRPICC